MSKLRNMVALSPAFQARGSLTFATALNSVFYEYVPGVDELIDYTKNNLAPRPQMPFAAVWPMSAAWTADGGGAQVWSIPGGMMHLHLACNPSPTILDWNDSRLEAVGFLDQWLADIIALSGSGVTASGDTSGDTTGYLTITKAAVALVGHSPYKTDDTTGNLFWYDVGLQYGDEA